MHQIHVELRILTKYFNMPELRVAAYFGGMDIEKNLYGLNNPRKIPHIIVSTLGRLKHLFFSEYIMGDNVHTMVIDECD